MDDSTFDQQTARDWIHVIETKGKTLRDDDIYPLLNLWLKRTSPVSILEIGSGQGICSTKINIENHFYTGVEPSSYLLDRAKQLYANENRTFLLGSIYQLPLSIESFEAIFSILVWHLLKDLQLAAQEMSRVLKKNGSFMITTANPDAYTEWIKLYTETKLDGKRLEGKMSLGKSFSQDVLYLHSLDEIKNSLINVGLVINRIEEFRPSLGEDKKMLISIQGRKI